MAIVSCAEVAHALPSILDGEFAAADAIVEHVGTCLCCQSELARYRKLLRLLNQLRAHRVEPPPGAVADILDALDALEQAAQRQGHSLRSHRDAGSCTPAPSPLLPRPSSR